jgi:putative transposase
MSRPLRIEFPGALYHVTSRGTEKGRVFRDDHDFSRRMEWAKRTVETYGWRIHAFALMPNHDHFFVETPEPNLCAGIHYFNSAYTGYFNHRHCRVGHLYQGRYKAILIENEGHYRELSRYIHLNPVRAGLAPAPEAYPWTSYHGYHRAGHALAWVTYSRVLGEFGRRDAEARKTYRAFVESGVANPPTSPLRGALHGFLIGSDAFVAKVRSLAGGEPHEDVPVARALRPRPTLERIAEATASATGEQVICRPRTRCNGSTRALVAAVARIHYGYSATEVARTLGYRGHSSVTQAIKRAEMGQCEYADALRRILAKLRPND